MATGDGSSGSAGSNGDLDGTVTWRELLAETAGRLARAGVEAPAIEARWIVEEASGMDRAELILGAEDLATQRGVARLDDMTGRRTGGEPIQYVLGHWPFRSLDLMCDRRVLIPRPETEQVVGHALDVLDIVAAGLAGRGPTVVDLGTGTGAIGLSMAAERPGSAVWLVDASPEAVAVARANLAGLGMAGGKVTIVEGSWFSALPETLVGSIDLVVANPPYIAADEILAPSVVDWEPSVALVSGPTGLEAYEAILADVGSWLAPGGAFVAELGATQAGAVSALARAAGLTDVQVHADHQGHPRTIVAR